MSRFSKSRSNRRGDERLSRSPQGAAQPVARPVALEPEELEPTGPTLGFWLVVVVGVPVMAAAFALFALFTRR
jgi:hypothetical protein